MAQNGTYTDPGLLLQGKAGKAGDQHGQQALAQVAKQGQDRQLAACQTQHVGGAGIA